MEQTLQQLVQLIMNTAPELWRIARQQVNVQLAIALVGFVSCTILLVCGIVIAKKIIVPNKHFYPAEDREERANVDFQLTVAFFVLIYLVPSVFLFIVVLQRLLNPDWYAIEVLRSLVR
jgi:hypothetical protein